MKGNFNRSLEHVLVHEGGWADHPRDPGGATMKGVTLLTYRRHYGEDRNKEDLRNISLSELRKIYKEGYWDKSRGDDLAAGIDYAVFDASVNSGPRRAASWLQEAVGVMQDGVIGINTLAKINKSDPHKVIKTMCEVRINFLRNLNTWDVFGVGWQRRVDGVRNVTIRMASHDKAPAISVPAIPVPSIEYTTVKNGSKGIWVRKIQEYLGVHVDGIFGMATEKSLKDWQRLQDLSVDGIAGRTTYKTMGLLG